MKTQKNEKKVLLTVHKLDFNQSCKDLQLLQL